MLIDNDYQLEYNMIIVNENHYHNLLKISLYYEFEEEIEMTLDNIKPGNSGIISSIGGKGMLRRRLLDMGLTPNTRVEVRKVAPMGDPIEIFLRSYVLTIRREEAAKIELKGEQ